MRFSKCVVAILSAIVFFLLASCGGGGGPSNSGTNTASPPPSITAVSPNKIDAGPSGAQITVTGSKFVSGATVDLDSLQLSTQFVSSTELAATVPAGPQVVAGAHKVSVVNPSGGGQSGTLSLTIVPSIAAVSPQQGVVGSSISVSVYGADPNNLANDQVTFTQAGRSFTAVPGSATTSSSAVLLQIVAPMGLAPADPTVNLAAPSAIGVVVNSFASGNSLSFEVQPPPHAIEVAPTSAEQGTSLTIALAGESTAFNSSTQITSDDPGLGVSSISVASHNLITATLTVGNAVPTGDHVLTATSGATPIAFHIIILPASSVPVLLTSLSTTSASPLAPLSLAGTGFTAGGQVNSSVVIQYTYGTHTAQFSARADSDIRINTAVPLLLDPATGTPFTGSVSVAVAVDGRQSNSLSFSLSALPPNSGAVGAATTAYINAVAAQVTSQRAHVDSLTGIPPDQASAIDSFFGAMSTALNRLKTDIATAAGGGTVTAPDGSTFSQSAVDFADRLLESSGLLSSGSVSAATSKGGLRSASLSAVTDQQEAQIEAGCSLEEQGLKGLDYINCAGEILDFFTGPVSALWKLLAGVTSLTAKLSTLLACNYAPNLLASVSFSPSDVATVVGGNPTAESINGTFTSDPLLVGKTAETVINFILGLLHVPTSCIALLGQAPVWEAEGLQWAIDEIVNLATDSSTAEPFFQQQTVALTSATVSLQPNPVPHGIVVIDESNLTVTPQSAGSTALYLDLSKFLLLDANGNSTTDSTQVSGNDLPVAVETLVTLSPDSASLDLGTQQKFTQTVEGTSDQTVSWSVDNVPGGNSTVGTISTSGLYTAPDTAGSHMITATSDFDGSTASATVTVLNQVATPTLNNVDPRVLAVGAFTLTVTGAGFVPGAQVLFSGSPLSTAFVSPTELTATGTSTTSELGTVPVSVENPGTASSNSIDVAVLASSGSSSGSTAVIVGMVGGKLVDKAYVPVPSYGTISVLNLDATSPTSSLVTTIPMPAGYSPNATAADQALLKVVVISYTSPDVQIIDASRDTAPTTLTSPVTQYVNFSGGSCVICGVAVDPSSGTAILDTAQGYLTLDLATDTFSSSFIPASPSENFAYNANTQLVLNPTYGTSTFTGLQAIHLPDGNILNYNSAVGNEPDAAAVDTNTNIAVIPDEFTGDQYLINLQAATSDSTTTPPSFSAPITKFAINFTDCGTELYDWSLVTAESTSHTLFLGTEFADCAAVEALPTSTMSGAPPTPTLFHWGHMPPSPDGFAWENGGDPHGIAVFTSVVDGKAYGFIVNADATWVARLDLSAVESASTLSGGGPGEVDLTSFVTFFPTQ